MELNSALSGLIVACMVFDDVCAVWCAIRQERRGWKVDGRC
ncbi:hypothetical protein CCACVL1_07292 [Corchorus capsularis]|uniref:Uncharacterized protein n=1 Tax=Corchorus capsularis TaxID=210143 RepID=A0A1R3J7K4_COCAP|nr:hypothetical protein CCACVL1_07292 [Corchorus capsularis]